MTRTLVLAAIGLTVLTGCRGDRFDLLPDPADPPTTEATVTTASDNPTTAVDLVTSEPTVDPADAALLEKLESTLTSIDSDITETESLLDEPIPTRND